MKNALATTAVTLAFTALAVTTKGQSIPENIFHNDDSLLNWNKPVLDVYCSGTDVVIIHYFYEPENNANTHDLLYVAAYDNGINLDWKPANSVYDNVNYSKMNNPALGTPMQLIMLDASKICAGNSDVDANGRPSGYIFRTQEITAAQQQQFAQMRTLMKDQPFVR